MSEELEARINEYRKDIGKGLQLKDDIAALMWGTIKEHEKINKDYLFKIAKEYYQKLPEKPYGEELKRHTFNSILSVFENFFCMQGNCDEICFQ